MEDKRMDFTNWKFTDGEIFRDVINARPELLREMIRDFFPEVELGKLTPDPVYAADRDLFFHAVMMDSEHRYVLARSSKYGGPGEDEVIFKGMIHEFTNISAADPERKEVYVFILTPEPYNEVRNRTVSLYMYSENRPGEKLSPFQLAVWYGGDSEGMNEEEP